MKTLNDHITATLEDNKRPIIYLAGKISGLPEAQYRAKFQQATAQLEEKGWQVINPCNLVKDSGMPWEDAMCITVRGLTYASAICLLPCSMESRGARIERGLASDFGLKRYEGVDAVPRVNGGIRTPGLKVLYRGEVFPVPGRASDFSRFHKDNRSKYHK